MSFHTRLFTSIIVLSYACLAHANDLLITNARIYTLTGSGTLENSSILVRDGVIHSVGHDLDVPGGIETIDASGKQITPGLISSYTVLGLAEIRLVKQTVDTATTDRMFSSSFNVAPAINPMSTLIPLNRTNGLTRALVMPFSGHHLFAGQGALISLADPTDFSVRESVFVMSNFGISGSAFAGGSRAAVDSKMRQAFIDAQEYQSNRRAVTKGEWRRLSLPLHDLEVLIKVLQGSMPLVVNVNRNSDIRAVLAIQKEFGFRLVIAGGTEAWMLADEIAAAKVPVILDPMANLPSDFDRLGARLDNAAILYRAGVTLLFSGPAYQHTHSAYLVRQGAGNAAAYGLPPIEAIKAMTLNPARVFGFSDRAGTIAPGQEADLVIWDGDPLELLTTADQVLIRGKKISMVSRSTRLRERYQELGSDQPLFFRK